MLSKLSLKNFKSAKDLSIRLAPLTILAGLNGSGKSSVLQAIALVKQSLDDDASGCQLTLDGPSVCIGFGRDVLYEASEKDEISIAFESDRGDFSWVGDVKTTLDTIDTIFTGDVVSLAQLFLGFQFIQANRIVPDNQYRQANSKNRERGSLGSHGEFTVDYLSQNANLRIPKARHYPTGQLKEKKQVDLMQSVAPTDSLEDVVSSWIQLLSPGARVIAKPVELSLSASLKFEYKGFSDVLRDTASNAHRPSNVGFGLTYSLPIIVACLSAQKGSILLLENPEAHLHPRGQSALGLLLALCAADGLQIVVETHSDHLMNGIRLAAKKGHIEAKNVAAHFFTRKVESGVSEISSPVLLDNGRFVDWPSGFFDEWDNALDELLESSPIQLSAAKE